MVTHSDIYTKFMIEYDKAMITSSYPNLTKYEVATLLDKAYLALIALKVTGNNPRGTSFEADPKAVEDIRPLVTTKKILAISYDPANEVTNAFVCNLPDDILYFVSATTKQYLVEAVQGRDYPKSRISNVSLVDHNTAKKFFASATNMPWVKEPVAFIEGDQIIVVYDLYESLLHKGFPSDLNVTYIKQPAKFAFSLGTYIDNSSENPSGGNNEGDNNGGDNSRPENPDNPGTGGEDPGNNDQPGNNDDPGTGNDPENPGNNDDPGTGGGNTNTYEIPDIVITDVQNTPDTYLNYTVFYDITNIQKTKVIKAEVCIVDINRNILYSNIRYNIQYTNYVNFSTLTDLTNAVGFVIKLHYILTQSGEQYLKTSSLYLYTFTSPSLKLPVTLDGTYRLDDPNYVLL